MMALRTRVAVVVLAALLAAACSSPADSQSPVQELPSPASIGETATPLPTVESLSAALGTIADTLRDAVLTAPPDWPTREDFELAISGHIGPSVADQVDLFLRYQQYASVYVASACVDRDSPTPSGFYSFVGRMVTAGRDTGVVLAESAESAIVSLVNDTQPGRPCVERYTTPESVSEAVLAAGVVEAIIMANEPASLPWAVEFEVYSQALEWFAETRDIDMLEWVCDQLGERACQLQSGD
jgi:hypothetical protein